MRVINHFYVTQSILLVSLWNDGTWADRSCLQDLGHKQAIAMPHVSQEQINKPHWALSEAQHLHIESSQLD